MPTNDHDESWHTAADGGLLCARTDGEVGCLVYLRGPGDAGFSTRNPDYRGPPDATVAFRLDSGQVDEHPRAWCYPIEVIDRAVAHFVATGVPPPFVGWHNDAGDGRPIVPRPPRHGERSARAR